jgi:hypothetical protein
MALVLTTLQLSLLFLLHLLTKELSVLILLLLLLDLLLLVIITWHERTKFRSTFTLDGLRGLAIAYTHLMVQVFSIPSTTLVDAIQSLAQKLAAYIPKGVVGKRFEEVAGKPVQVAPD